MFIVAKHDGGRSTIVKSVSKEEDAQDAVSALQAQALHPSIVFWYAPAKTMVNRAETMSEAA